MTEFIRDAAGVGEAQQKKALAYHFRQDSPGLATDGVLAGLVVSQQTTASKYVDVGIGSAVTQDSGSNGASQLVNDAVKAVAVLVADVAEANPRNDLIVFDSATNSVRKIKGTANATPSDPSVPATAVKLARVRVKSATAYAGTEVVSAADIDDLRPFTSLATSVQVASSAERDRIAAVNGLRVFRTDTKVFEVYYGGVWRPETFAEECGTWTAPNQAAGNTSTQSVTFAAGRFTTIPRVQVTAGNTRLNVAAVNVTTSGFDLQSSNWTAATATGAPIWWHAVQMTA